MSDFVLTRSGSIIDFRPMSKGAWARVYSKGTWMPWAGMPDSLLGSRSISEKEAIKLTNPDIWLAESAQATLDCLLEEIHKTRIIDSMCDCYSRYLKLYGGRNGLKSRKMGQRDRARMLFEILCFATFTIVVRVVPGYIKAKFSAVNHASDSHYIYRFNQQLLDCLDRFLNAQKIRAVRGLVITSTRYQVKFGSGESMDPAKRIACYLSAGSIEKELRLFCDSLGYAIDPADLQITEVIGLSHSGVVLDIISRTLKAIFEK